MNAKNLDARLARRAFRRAAQVGERSGDIGQILLTRGRQHQAASQPREQRPSDHGFEVGNLMTDRGRRQPQFIGRPIDAFRAGDTLERDDSFEWWDAHCS
jgi:hypothetical protein